jgi:ubiquinone/menaquinone biosynthesis C-methylase UbiE
MILSPLRYTMTAVYRIAISQIGPSPQGEKMESHEISIEKASSKPTYVLDNAAPQTPARFTALSELYDAATRQYLEDCGVGPGWNCLEVGGGGGSIAAWLAERVGPSGDVLVTDLDPRFIDKLPNLEIRRHNIVPDPLPDNAFDLIHTRLVLIHIPEREEVLARLVAALKPGGWIIEEDFDTRSLYCEGALLPPEVHLKTQAAIFRYFDDNGVERHWGRLVHGRMQSLGLVNLRSEARISMWRAGSKGTSFMRTNFEQLRNVLVAGGYVSEEDFEKDIAMLDDPQFVVPSPIMWTTFGCRPSAS